MEATMYALSGRRGDDGGRYLSTQWDAMKRRAWQMNRSGESVQVFRVGADGSLRMYDDKATQRVTRYIVAGLAALSRPAGGR